MREYLEVLLSRGGYQVVTAPDVATAVDTILKNNLDVVISDIKLGQESGLAVLRAARASATPPEVILITAYGTPATAVEAMREGAYDYICKPFDNEELMLLVQKALEKRELLRENRERRAGYSDSGRKEPGDATGLGIDQQSGELPVDRFDYRGKWHRQGVGGASHPLEKLTFGPTLLASELRRAGGGSTGKRAVRPRQGSLYRRHCGSGGNLGLRGRWVGLPRRDRRDLTGDAGQAPSRAPRKARQAGRKLGGDSIRSARSCRHQSKPGGRGEEWEVPGRPLLPAQCDRDRVAAVAQAPGRYWHVGKFLPRSDEGDVGSAGAEFIARYLGAVGSVLLSRQRTAAGKHHRTGSDAGGRLSPCTSRATALLARRVGADPPKRRGGAGPGLLIGPVSR